MTEGFYIFLVSSGIAFFIGLTRMVYKSKCIYCKFMGIEIKRDAEAEIEDNNNASESDKL